MEAKGGGGYRGGVEGVKRMGQKFFWGGGGGGGAEYRNCWKSDNFRESNREKKQRAITKNEAKS